MVWSNISLKPVLCSGLFTWFRELSDSFITFTLRLAITEAYLEPCQTSKMQLITKNVKGLNAVNYFHKKLTDTVKLQRDFIWHKSSSEKLAKKVSESWSLTLKPCSKHLHFLFIGCHCHCCRSRLKSFKYEELFVIFSFLLLKYTPYPPSWVLSAPPQLQINCFVGANSYFASTYFLTLVHHLSLLFTTVYCYRYHILVIGSILSFSENLLRRDHITVTLSWDNPKKVCFWSG